ncbi:hypothetical protein SKAU_G00079190 [Synaphobranchus kaupii]|uniref:Uncharacterized protein n=1 Tax=Synaphobranchus kaupii TaxID=118154 RepID=A0A9Q1J5B4_SYNKA|nr:hypothetical protein SKAU_G00079190 [Synaphobranchus kaupii]
MHIGGWVPRDSGIVRTPFTATVPPRPSGVLAVYPPPCPLWHARTEHLAVARPTDTVTVVFSAARVAVSRFMPLWLPARETVFVDPSTRTSVFWVGQVNSKV